MTINAENIVDRIMIKMMGLISTTRVYMNIFGVQAQ